MAELPGLPEEVPQEYRDQLIKFQNQIKILLKNHQVKFYKSYFSIRTDGGFGGSKEKI